MDIFIGVVALLGLAWALAKYLPKRDGEDTFLEP
jgi:hypothetical protein